MTTPPDLSAWRTLAERELKASSDALTWHTPEGVDVKPLYTEAYLAGLPHLGSLPGLAPWAG